MSVFHYDETSDDPMADPPPPPEQYLRSNARTVREISDAILDIAFEVVGRTPRLQSPLVAVLDDADGIAYVRPSGATKAGPPEVTMHRPASRVTRSRKGRSSYVVTRVREAVQTGPDPIRELLAGPRERVDIVTMTGRALVDLADRLYRDDGLEPLIGKVDGTRSSYSYETEPLLQTRTPSKREARRNLMTPRDTDNPSVARWSGDMLAYFPEVRDRQMVEGDETSWGDAIDGNARSFDRPRETYGARMGLGAIHPRRDSGETDVITDGNVVHLIAPDVDEDFAWIGHLRYERPATRETKRSRKRATVKADKLRESPEVIALSDEVDAHLVSDSEPNEWVHGNYEVSARWSETKRRYRVSVYATMAGVARGKRVQSFDARTASAIALRLSTLS